MEQVLIGTQHAARSTQSTAAYHPVRGRARATSNLENGGSARALQPVSILLHRELWSASTDQAPPCCHALQALCTVQALTLNDMQPLEHRNTAPQTAIERKLHAPLTTEMVHMGVVAAARLAKACEHRPQCPLEQAIRLTVDESVHRETNATAKLVRPASSKWKATAEAEQWKGEGAGGRRRRKGRGRAKRGKNVAKFSARMLFASG